MPGPRSPNTARSGALRRNLGRCGGSGRRGENGYLSQLSGTSAVPDWEGKGRCHGVPDRLSVLFLSLRHILPPVCLTSSLRTWLGLLRACALGLSFRLPFRPGATICSAQKYGRTEKCAAPQLRLDVAGRRSALRCLRA